MAELGSMAELLNMVTGEIISTTPPRRRAKIAATKQAIGIDTKYPSDCLTADHLVESLVNLDAYVHNKPDIDYAMLADSVMDKLLTIQEAAILRFIATNLAGWNYWYGCRAAFGNLVVPTSLTRTLLSLVDKGMIVILHKDTPIKNSLVLRLNPVIAFRGGAWFRDTAIRRWYTP